MKYPTEDRNLAIVEAMVRGAKAETVAGQYGIGKARANQLFHELSRRARLHDSMHEARSDPEDWMRRLRTGLRARTEAMAAPREPAIDWRLANHVLQLVGQSRQLREGDRITAQEVAAMLNGKHSLPDTSRANSEVVAAWCRFHGVPCELAPPPPPKPIDPARIRAAVNLLEKLGYTVTPPAA